MLTDLRSGSGVRAALCLAAVLSLAGSAGLHPEPSAVSIRDAGLTVTLDAGAGGFREAPHVCQVCTLYFVCSLTPTGPVTPGVQPARPAVVRSRTPFGGGPDVRRHEGRAPPLAS